MADWLTVFTSLVQGYMPYYMILTITIFLIGIISLSVKWFSRPPKEVPVKTEGVAKLSVGTRVKVILKTVFGFWIGSFQVLKNSKLRWIMHFSIFIGAAGLVIFHAAIKVIITPIFGLTEEDIWFPGAPLWIRVFSHNIFFFLLIFGVSIALVRRIVLRKMQVMRNAYNFAPLLIILSIAVLGLFSGYFSPIPVAPEWQDFFLLLHGIIVYTTIAYFPYGKFVHILATPAIILKRSIDDRMRQEWYKKFGGGV
jgi:nitrate reductase gamma subunit